MPPAPEMTTIKSCVLMMGVNLSSLSELRSSVCLALSLSSCLESVFTASMVHFGEGILSKARVITLQPIPPKPSMAVEVGVCLLSKALNSECIAGTVFELVNFSIVILPISYGTWSSFLVLWLRVRA